MNKKIEFNHNGKNIVLEYDRNSAVKMERIGFHVNEIEKEPLTQMQLLFRGAFIKNHKNMSQNEIDEIYNSISNRQELNEALMQMYADVYQSTIGDSEVDDSKKIAWKMS